MTQPSFFPCRAAHALAQREWGVRHVPWGSARGLLAATLAACLLTACGGGTLDPHFTPTNSQASGEGTATRLTGTFVDSPVSGLSYVTSSGISGVTDAQGHFQFQAGDTITFRIAGVDLGTIPAGTTLTPASLAGGDEDSARFSNLLVMLQSLDTDGDPSNGITLNPEWPTSQVRDIVALLDADPIDFADGGYNVGLQSLAAGGYIRSPEEATRHYASAMALLDPFLGEAAGVWQATGDDGTAYVLRLSTSGRYVLASAQAASPSGSGVSVGRWARDPQGQWAVQEVKLDTRSTPVASGLQAGESLGLQLLRGAQGAAQDQLVLQRTLAPWGLVFHRAAQSADLVGAWSTTPELKPGSLTLLFGEPDAQSGQGTVTVLDPEGDLSCEPGGLPIPGVELGVFVQDANALSFQMPTVDTNGCSGISNGHSPIGPLVYTVSPDGATLTLILPAPDGSGLDPSPVTLYRLGRQP